MLAYLALKLLPIVADHVLCILLHLLLRLDPIPQTLIVDQADGTSALACQNERVLWHLLSAPAEPAVFLFLITKTKFTLLQYLLSQVSGSSHLDCLSELLLMSLLLTLLRCPLGDLDLLDLEADSAELDDIELLYLVVLLCKLLRQKYELTCLPSGPFRERITSQSLSESPGWRPPAWDMGARG